MANGSPNCPLCGSGMILRTQRKNGSQFWGCEMWQPGGIGCSGRLPGSASAGPAPGQRPMPPGLQQNLARQEMGTGADLGRERSIQKQVVLKTIGENWGRSGVQIIQGAALQEFLTVCDQIYQAYFLGKPVLNEQVQTQPVQQQTAQQQPVQQPQTGEWSQ